MAEGKFVTVINCMDGRTQLPVNAYMKETYGADYVDTITEAGPDGILAKGDHLECESMRARVRISVDNHGSEVVAIVAHDDCAGNPESKDEHLADLDSAVTRVVDWGFNVKVVALWVNGEDWSVEEVKAK